MTAVYKRELYSGFRSMIAEVFIALVMCYTGVYFTAYNLNYGYPLFSYTLSSIAMVLVISVPLLTMRSFAEEQRNRTDQLLLTSPVPVGKIVIGKFASMCTIIAIPCAIFCLYPLMIRLGGTAYFKIDYLSILTFFLLGCVFVAIGMFLSSLTESQIIAYVSSFGVFMAIYLWNGLTGFLSSSAISSLIGLLVIWLLVCLYLYRMSGSTVIGGIAAAAGTIALSITYGVKSSLFEGLLPNLLDKLALIDVMSDISNTSVFDISGLVLYLSLIVLFVFLTMQHIQKRRWK